MPIPDLKRLRRAGVVALVFDRRGRLLLHHRTDNHHWGLPGGSIEKGETIVQAAIREVREETGYRVKVMGVVGVYSHPRNTTIRYPEGNVVSYVSIAVKCRPVGGKPVLSDESKAVDWFFPHALPRPFLPNHRLRVRDALKGRKTTFLR